MKVSISWAPETEYCRSKMKAGTPVMPSTAAWRSEATTPS
jgi:hypothetical protein